MAACCWQLAERSQAAMTETEAEAEAPKAEMTEKAPEARKVVHTDWWVPGGSPTLDEYFSGIKADFQDLNPGTTVEYAFVKGTDRRADHVTVMIAAGEQVDSSQVSVAFILELVAERLSAAARPVSRPGTPIQRPISSWTPVASSTSTTA